MFAAVVYVKVFELGGAKFGLGKHSLNDLDEEGMEAILEMTLEALCHQLAGSEYALAAGIAGVAQILALSHFVAVEHDLVGIDDDDVVAAVEVGREVSFIFAAEDLGDDRAKATENDAFGIDDHPLLLDSSGSDGEGLIA